MALAICAAINLLPMPERFVGMVLSPQAAALTVFSLVRAIQPDGEARDGNAARPFVQTGANSWAETDLAKFDPNALTAPDESAGDILGPVTIGATVAVPVKSAEPAPTPAAATGDTAKPAPPETRIAAIGDSEFVTNTFVSNLHDCS